MNAQFDSNRMNYVQNAMIKCGLSFAVAGMESESQLKQELQDIIAKRWLFFEGLPVIQDMLRRSPTQNKIEE